MSDYAPLYEPSEEPAFPASVDVELRVARDYLDQVAAANIHDQTAMLRAAVGCHHRLRSLIAAIDAERGEQP